ncbi:MerR family transcriptional regulator [Staphylococcus equorum]|uniref:MerR family transcriptional regulator n=1 Tax=Staphylococcus equorum TaxID=246432 RepID=UPI00298240B5|nr:MerR family transcriptional regulator [Staphylococcus equorum]MDW5471956.1 MerR family transcriptional regulator [Staphylococcus equorum]
MYYTQDVKKIIGINSSAMRYYEKEGILPVVKRDKNGNRIYTDENIIWLKFIKLLRDTDMGIEDIKRYVYLFNQGLSTIEKRRDILSEHKQKIKNEIKDKLDCLDQINYKLGVYDEKVRNIDKDTINDDCPI